MRKRTTILAVLASVCLVFGSLRAQGGNETIVGQPDSLDTSTPPEVPVDDVVEDLIDFAKTFLGTPYKWAGTTPSGFDCSGFIYYVMGNFGFQLTRTSYGMAELGKTVKLANIRPGDLLFFRGRNPNSTTVAHVGMVTEVGPDKIMFIHASTSKGVTIDNLKGSKYYVPRYLKAKRLDYGVPDEN